MAVNAVTHTISSASALRQGPAKQIFDAPRHAYTKSLMAATFELRAGGQIGLSP